MNPLHLLWVSPTIAAISVKVCNVDRQNLVHLRWHLLSKFKKQKKYRNVLYKCFLEHEEYQVQLLSMFYNISWSTLPHPHRQVHPLLQLQPPSHCFKFQKTVFQIAQHLPESSHNISLNICMYYSWPTVIYRYNIDNQIFSRHHSQSLVWKIM